MKTFVLLAVLVVVATAKPIDWMEQPEEEMNNEQYAIVAQAGLDIISTPNYKYVLSRISALKTRVVAGVYYDFVVELVDVNQEFDCMADINMIVWKKLDGSLEVQEWSYVYPRDPDALF
eukprot:CAMPEP_0201513148 /NCGR_PEP_ID=MMETSP0161_2-20130828/5260_1 /ASSEMBLY_ACC=CAM_ASM_000251 /TAXON_ID=180227 /ORGANISM="Neoparamoeba aestuarina, Strain SoJaBio B1-5/56/2" /LENGTH=118 /DNA_ID=CAMNT_0047909247 /DNA_START=105 /DNA_END=461 /DNA_ORIENTATION=-